MAGDVQADTADRLAVTVKNAGKRRRVIADARLPALAGQVNVIGEAVIARPTCGIAHQCDEFVRCADLRIRCRAVRSRSSHNKREHAEQHAQRQDQAENFLLHSFSP